MTPRLERAVAARLERVREDIAARIARVPGVVATIEGGTVIATGRRLKARWLNDARLRWLEWER